MPPIRRVTFLGADGKPIRPQPSRLTRTENEVQGDAAEQEDLVEFGQSRAPAPARASVQHTVLPAPVGAAQELTRLRRSNALRVRSRRRSKRRMAKPGSRPARRTMVSRSRTRSRRAGSRPGTKLKRRARTNRTTRGTRKTRTRVVRRRVTVRKVRPR